MGYVTDEPKGIFEHLVNFAYEDSENEHIVTLRKSQSPRQLYKYVNQLCEEKGCKSEADLQKLSPTAREEELVTAAKCKSCPIAAVYILGTQAAFFRERYLELKRQSQKGCFRCRTGVYRIGKEKYEWMQYCPECGKKLK